MVFSVGVSATATEDEVEDVLISVSVCVCADDVKIGLTSRVVFRLGGGAGSGFGEDDLSLPPSLPCDLDLALELRASGLSGLKELPDGVAIISALSVAAERKGEGEGSGDSSFGTRTVSTAIATGDSTLGRSASTPGDEVSFDGLEVLSRFFLSAVSFGFCESLVVSGSVALFVGVIEIVVVVVVSVFNDGSSGLTLID